MRWQKGIWSSIEVVITSTTGNRVAANTARGFESLLLRQKGSPGIYGFWGFPLCLQGVWGLLF